MTTESRHGRRVRRRRPLHRPGSVAVVLVAWVAFLAVFAGLAIQLREGRDPVLGAQAPTVSAERPVLRRRVIRRVVITDRRPAAAPAVLAAPPATSVVPASAAPAPAPAPVTTQSS